jgi:hypothetical protein
MPMSSKIGTTTNRTIAYTGKLSLLLLLLLLGAAVGIAVGAAVKSAAWHERELYGVSLSELSVLLQVLLKRM